MDGKHLIPTMYILLLLSFCVVGITTKFDSVTDAQQRRIEEAEYRVQWLEIRLKETGSRVKDLEKGKQVIPEPPKAPFIKNGWQDSPYGNWYYDGGFWTYIH